MNIDQLPNARRAIILDWLREHKRAAIESLAAQFNVSAMTIHRDVAELVKSGQVQKVHGGVVWVETLPQTQPVIEGKCEMCGVPATRMPFIMKEADGQTHTACCPHCGLMMLNHLPALSTILTTDFLYGRTVSAKSAVYVVGSDVQMCCAPSVLSFTCVGDAEKFITGFGGKLMSYDEALMLVHHH